MGDEIKTPDELMAEALKALPPVELFDRSRGMVPLDASIRPPIVPVSVKLDAHGVGWVVDEEFLHYRPITIKPGEVTWVRPVNWAPPKGKTAKNKRRARARWRAREVRRNAGVPFTLAPSALPAPAPAPAGTPEPGAALGALLRKFEDALAGLVPLPAKPKPVERPYVPNKWGEHGD